MSDLDTDEEAYTTCSICSRRIKLTYLNKHQRRNHPDAPRKRKFKENITCCVCHEQFIFRQAYREHVSENHCLIEKQEFKFASLEDFSRWLKTEENRIKIRFIRLRSPTTLSTGNTRIDYYCQYDNAKHSKVIPQGKRKRALRYQGSYKLNGCCPAGIITDIHKRTGRVSVTYYSTHLGHDSTMAHFFLRLEEKVEIADRIKAGMSFDKILEDIKDNISPTDLKRADFITRKTLHNIVAQFKIETHQKQVDETTNTSLWIERMKKCKNNAVCYFKKQGETDQNYPSLSKTDLLLVIITENQAKMLCDFGDRMICVDSIHVTNQNEFLITTILVIDDHEEEFPGAYLISNRTDPTAIELFFDFLRSKIGRRLTPSIFMSDDDSTYYNSWIEIMKPDVPPQRLLYTWRVDKNWREGLNKIEGKKDEVKERQTTVYRMIRFLLEEMDETVFKTSLDAVINNLMSDDSTRKFAKYFHSTYAHRPEMWASCYRIGASINTNIRLENFHRLIKTVNSSGMKTISLDACIDILLKIVRDKSHERIMKLTHMKAPYVIQQINSAHKRSYEIDDDDVIENNPSHFEVKSRSDSDSSHVVRKIHENCPFDCDLTCNACNTCMHIYSCTCMDFLVRIRMCKHIHKVCTLLHSANALSVSFDPSFDISESVLEGVEIVELTYISSEENEENNIAVDNTTVVEKMKNNIAKLTQILDNSTSLVGLEELDGHIEKFFCINQNL